MRPKMTQSDRAKQFMPFTALRGYEDALRKKEKIRVPRVELTEYAQERLNRRLLRIRKRDMVTVTYYHGGEYLQKTGMVAAFQPEYRRIRIVDTVISLDDLLDIRPAETQAFPALL